MAKIRVLPLLMALALQGCLDASTVVTGAQMSYNHYSLTNTLHDHYVTMRADQAIHFKNDKYKDSNIAVSTFNNVVVLTGQVPTKELHDGLVGIVNTVPGVEHVYNLTTISNPSSPITTLSDTWITTKIRSQLLASNDVDPSQIKVITENGNVYLMGIIYPDQADAAVEIARSTTGVQQVIRIFSYLHISKQHDLTVPA